MKNIFGKWNWIAIGVLIIIGVISFVNISPEAQKEIGHSLLKSLIVGIIFAVGIVTPLFFFFELFTDKQSQRTRCPTCGQELSEENGQTEKQGAS